MQRHLITYALPYANGSIHIGHMLGFIQTDIHARFSRLIGNDTLFICGSDMHGTPIEINAAKAGIGAAEFAEKYWLEHQKTFTQYGISFDNYYHTNSKENKELAEYFFRELRARGHIYVSSMKVVYCEHCARSLPDRFVKGECPKCQATDQYGDVCEKCSSVLKGIDLINPYCTLCNSVKGRPIAKDSKHYFFRLSSFFDELSTWVASRESGIQKEIKNWLADWMNKGLEDWCISRDGPYFGFEIPGSLEEMGEKKYFYVWLDAPVGYISSTKNFLDTKYGSAIGVGGGARGVGEGRSIHNQENPTWQDYFQRGVAHHLIGKDIVYFHYLFWPAMLRGMGIPFPRISTHGFITVNGQKMSKSRGTFYTADDFLKLFPCESLRFYYASHLDTSVSDIDLSFANLQAVNNNVYLGNVANFCYRTLTFAQKNYGIIEHVGIPRGEQLQVDALIAEIKDKYLHLDFKSAVQLILRLSDIGNSMFQKAEPWKTKNDPQTKAIVGFCVNLARNLAIIVSPIVPTFSQKVYRAVGECDDVSGHGLKWSDISFHFKGQLFEPEMLAVKIETIPCEKKFPLDLCVGKIVDVRAHSNADSLYVLSVDFGARGRKQVVAGLRKDRSVEQLIGLEAVFCLSLKPAKLRGEMSEAMVMIADGKTAISFLGAPGLKIGEAVAPRGFVVSSTLITYDEFKKIGLVTLGDTVVFEGAVLESNGVAIRVDGVANGSPIL